MVQVEVINVKSGDGHVRGQLALLSLFAPPPFFQRP